MREELSLYIIQTSDLDYLGALHYSGPNSLGGVTNNVHPAGHGLAQGSEGAPGDALLPLGSSCS